MAHLNTGTKALSGFTIVELLIVIVVIGILAAITIVSYSGITARANTIKNLTNAENVGKVANAYNAEQPTGSNGYPAAFGNLTYPNQVVQVPTGFTLGSTLPTAGTPTVISYVVKGTGPYTGACIGYWNYNTPALNYLAVGDANASGITTCS